MADDYPKLGSEGSSYAASEVTLYGLGYGGSQTTSRNDRIDRAGSAELSVAKVGTYNTTALALRGLPQSDVDQIETWKAANSTVEYYTGSSASAESSKILETDLAAQGPYSYDTSRYEGIILLGEL